MWSLVKAIPTTRTFFRPFAPRSLMTFSVLGPNHRTGPTSDWYERRNGFLNPPSFRTSWTLAPTSWGRGLPGR